MQPMINTLLDPVVNFGKVTVSGGYTSTDTEIHLITGDGSKLPNPVPSGSFNLVWFNNSTYSDPADDPYVEIVRCIARVDDTLTLMRHQEGTLASDKNIPTKIYKMILSPTKKTIDDIGVESQSKVNTHSALSTGVHGIGADTIDGVNARNIAISTHSSVVSSVHNFDGLGDAPAQTHGISRHTGSIGTWANIDKTTSSIADITTRSHASLTDIGTNTHTTIDTAISNSTTHIGASVAHGVTSDIVGISDIQTLTNKTLNMSGDLIFSGAQKIIGGTTSTSDLTLQTTSGVGTVGADMHFLVGNNGGTDAITILNSGNVGIGTANPYSKISMGTTSPTVLSRIAFYEAADGTQFRGIGMANPGGTYGIGIWTDTTPTDSNPDVFIKDDGNMGIGTTSPNFKLSLEGTSAGAGIYINNTTAANRNATLYVNDNGYFSIRTNGGNDRLNIDMNGNVGIGVNPPTAKLHVGGTSGVDGIKFPDGTLQTTAAASSVGYEMTANKNVANGYAGLDSNKTIAHLIPKVASNNIRNSHDAEIIQGTPGYPTYIKFKTITLTKGLRGTARFLFDIRAETSGKCWAQIYRNGVALGSVQSETTYSYVTKSQDITQEWGAGDTCELWCNGAFSRAFARNFRIAYDDAPNVVESSNSTP